MKLYEITKQHEHVLEAVKNTEDTPQNIQDDILNDLEGTFNDKAISIAAYIKNLKADIEAMKQAETAMAARRKAKQLNIDWLQNYLLENMQIINISNIECPQFKISIRNNPPAVYVSDEEILPNEYKRLITEVRVDKALIKKTIKSGVDVPGASLLMQRQSLIIK